MQTRSSMCWFTSTACGVQLTRRSPRPDRLCARDSTLKTPPDHVPRGSAEPTRARRRGLTGAGTSIDVHGHPRLYCCAMTAPRTQELTRLAERLKAVADTTRLRILQLLPTRPDCKLVYNVSELAEELQIPQPTVSHHLKVLYNAGLVKSEKMCRDVYYWIDKQAVDTTMCSVKSIARVEDDQQ
ncbi:MAG: metalloregulator ArsR/SmtB family transcription factor [Chitinivibrionales bacterium]|nr:metalloregulator ArsR/SmtB family transcription factor [Chitinivibrionales bacterium]